MNNTRDFVFSIVMAVYNAAPYLPETFRSVRNQSIGFDSVQVILVDDGSTDGSGKICDEFAKRYPQNVTVLHQKNAGPSAARNHGLEYAAGRYLNFMDSDDRMAPETLEKVEDFLADHEEETDVAAVPVRYFGAEEAEHWQNAAFDPGSRVINLKTDFRFLQAAANSAFFVRKTVGDVRFQEGLNYAEDTRYAMTCLARLETIGLVKGGCYEYRRRETGNSLSQTAGKNPLWKTKWMDEYELWAVDYFLRRQGSVPRWVQYALICHLGNRIRVDRIAGASTEEPWYTEKFRRIVSLTEPAVFPAAEEAGDGNRLLLRSLMKPGGEVSLRWEKGNWNLNLGEETVCRIHSIPVRVDCLEAQGNLVKLEGFIYLFPGMGNTEIRANLVRGERQWDISLKRTKTRDWTWNGYPVREAYAYSVTGETDGKGRAKLSFFFRMPDGGEPIRGEIIRGDRIPVLPIPRSTGWSGGWKYIVSANAVYLFPCSTVKARAKREAAWCLMLIRKKQTGALRKRIQFRLMQAFGKTPRWAGQIREASMDHLSSEEKYNADLLF